MCSKFFAPFSLNFTFATMKTTHFKNTTISYTDQGKGTAVVLLHGFLENKKMYYLLVYILTATHLRRKASSKLSLARPLMFE
jgi:hypothetical protein